MINRRTFLMLGLMTLLGFGIAGWAIAHFAHGESISEILEKDMKWYYQLAIGLPYGTLTAMLGWLLIKAHFMTPVREFYAEIIQDLKLNYPDIFFISFCAGLGEELFFRAGLQPWLGIWITSVLFVAIHGYLNPMNWRVSIYGIVMTFVIAGIGYMYKHFGLVAAASAHFAIDVVLLVAINNYRKV